MHAAIFPGQGAQEVGMARDVADQHKVAADTFAEADSLLGFELSKLCFDGPAERLNATDIQQPAIFTTSVALFRAGCDTGLFKADQFDHMAGLSLGEYTALHLAGAMSFADALKLVHQRGRLMQQASESSAGGMVSLMGADEERALALCEKVAEHGRVAPANFNCPGQIVISGDKPACTVAAARAADFDCKGILLDVAGAFHSPLMQPAADALHEALAATPIEAPRCRVVSNVDVEPHEDPDRIRETLVRQVVNPVRWQACVEKMIADGVQQFWEVGPKRVLTGLNRKIDRSVKTTNISKAESLAAK